MIKISTPATSANLSVGFDTLGIALNLYNEFQFEQSPVFRTVGFNSRYTIKTNLVIKSYIAFAKEYVEESKVIPVKVSLLKEDIPISRGLGSSASCILAGVVAANEIHGFHKSLEECASFASKFEGHPDNIFACAFGMLTATFQASNKYVYDVFGISDDLVFTLLTPEQRGNTKQLRNVLKNKVSLQDAVFNLSRMIHVPKGFAQGDLVLLKDVLQDTLHEQYRFPFIPRYQELQELGDDIITCISGSGSSVLLISKKSITKQIKHLNNSFTIKELNASEGIKVEVIS
jgi:homoserine kinase